MVPQQELDRLRHTTQATPPLDTPIRTTAENELDSDIQRLLLTPYKDIHEKAKKYSSILQRYLSFVRQGANEKNILTLSLPPDSASNPAEAAVSRNVNSTDSVVSDIMKHMSQRNRNNALHIVDALSKFKEHISWNTDGQLIIDGGTVAGTHIYDLLKNITAPHRISDANRPIGWHKFLSKIATLNIPLSGIPNSDVKRFITDMRHDETPQEVHDRQGNIEASGGRTGRRRERARRTAPVGSWSPF